VWVAQEIWYSYAFASFYGIIDALKEQLTGKGLGGEQNIRPTYINPSLFRVGCDWRRYTYW
jgi:hypothetical protein